MTADGKPLDSSPEFSADLFVVKVTYTNGSTKILDGKGLVIPEYDQGADGSNTWNGIIEASYGGKTIQKTFVLETIEAPVYPNDDSGNVTYKELVSLSIYQTRPATDGEPFDPSLFRSQAEYAGGPSEDLDGDGYVYLQDSDGTMNRGDSVMASIRTNDTQVLCRRADRLPRPYCCENTVLLPSDNPSRMEQRKTMSV